MTSTHSVPVPELCVPCSVCGAEAGQPCTSDAGGEGAQYHAIRAVDARAAGFRSSFLPPAPTGFYVSKPMSAALRRILKLEEDNIRFRTDAALRDTLAYELRQVQLHRNHALDNYQAALARVLMIRNELRRREAGHSSLMNGTAQQRPLFLDADDH